MHVHVCTNTEVPVLGIKDLKIKGVERALRKTVF
jgi:hypothetical protein